MLGKLASMYTFKDCRIKVLWHNVLVSQRGGLLTRGKRVILNSVKLPR